MKRCILCQSAAADVVSPFCTMCLFDALSLDEMRLALQECDSMEQMQMFARYLISRAYARLAERP